MGERCTCNAEAVGSLPTESTNSVCWDRVSGKSTGCELVVVGSIPAPRTKEEKI